MPELKQAGNAFLTKAPFPPAPTSAERGHFSSKGISTQCRETWEISLLQADLVSHDTTPPHPIQPSLLSLQYSLPGFSLCSRLLFPSATDWGATTEIYWAHYPYFKGCEKECMTCVPGKGLDFVWPQINKPLKRVEF